MDPELQQMLLEHRAALTAQAFHLCGNSADAEDLVQDTTLRAMERFSTFVPGSNGRAWLLSILRHLFIDRCRRERSRPRGGSIEEVSEPAAPEREPEPLWAWFGPAEIAVAVARLDPKARRMFLLFYVEKRSYGEISASLRIAENTVGSRLSRTREKMKKLLAAQVSGGVANP